jgi:hypothetical protein
MAHEANLREIAESVDRAFKEHADATGWPSQQYRIYLKYNPEWNYIHIIVAADQFPGGGEIRDQARATAKFMDEKLDDILKNVSDMRLTLRTFSQIDEGGIYAISPEFIDVKDILAGHPVS